MLIFSGCSPKKASQENSPDELVIVATTDLHATLDKAEGMAATVRELNIVTETK